MRGDRGHATVGVLTIIPEEFAAVKEALGLHENLPASSYFVAEVTEDHTYGVVLLRSGGRTNHAAGQATRDLIEHFRPHFLLLIGIAGGVEEDSLGDVIIANFVEYYEYLKLVDGQELTRREPHDQPSEYLRMDIAVPRQFEDWHAIVPAEERPGEPDLGRAIPLVREENIAVGEKLLADGDSGFQRRVLEKLSHCRAVDMESYGFMKELFHSRRSIHYNPLGLIIRGVSDVVNDPANDDMRKMWRPYAAKVAAAYGRAVVVTLLKAHPSRECCQ